MDNYIYSSEKIWYNQHIQYRIHTPMDASSIIQTNIFDLLGLQKLPDARKDELLNQMAQVIQDRITDRLIEAMSGEQRTAFEKLLDTNPEPNQVDDFLKQAVPGYEQIAQEEAQSFKQEITNEAAVVRQIAQAA